MWPDLIGSLPPTDPTTEYLELAPLHLSALRIKALFPRDCVVWINKLLGVNQMPMVGCMAMVLFH
jgi:hypothetical protein